MTMDPDNNFQPGGGPQTTQPAETVPASPFAAGSQPVVQPAGQTTGNVTEPQVQQQPAVQQTSPFDPPPPPSGEATGDATSELKEVITPQKTKGKFPILVVLIILILLVLGGVGFLAYQNMQLKNQGSSLGTGNTLVPVASPIPTSVPNPYLNFKTINGENIPVSFMVPNDWVVEESNNPDLGNQKLIDVKSPDFAYQGASISAGFELRIGPVSDLTKKYTSFEEFAAEINKDNSYDLVTYNNVKFLKNQTTAQTLIDKNPVTIALYTSQENNNEAIILFNNIMATFKIITTPATTLTPASASITPSI